MPSGATRLVSRNRRRPTGIFPKQPCGQQGDLAALAMAAGIPILKEAAARLSRVFGGYATPRFAFDIVQLLLAP
ncbi:hypothetical protein K32_09930 [Kaistia sp. 32K]|nr:hypothetical protein K32_09930 [Kaistia sp. 32K]